MDYKNFILNKEEESRAGNDYTDQPCEDGWKYFAHTGMCYKYFYGRYTWDSAREFCKKQNSESGDTVTIQDSQTNNFLKEITSSPIWTSGRKQGSHWEWADGSRISYKNWKSGEPNNYADGEHCLEFNVQYRRGKWNDRHCPYKMCTICQYHLGADYGSNCMPGYPCEKDTSTGSGKSKSIYHIHI